QREATGKVIAATAVEAHSRAVLPGDNPKTVVLNLVQPLAAGRQLVGFGGEARRDEPGRKGTLQHADLNRIEPRRLQLQHSTECFSIRPKSVMAVTDFSFSPLLKPWQQRHRSAVQLVMTHPVPPCASWQAPARLRPLWGRGAYAIRALPSASTSKSSSFHSPDEREAEARLSISCWVTFHANSLDHLVSAGVHGNPQQPRLRQKPQQIIRDHESTLGQHKKLPARK